jgi:hypothetical protein
MEKIHHEFSPQIEPTPENQGITEIDPVAQEAEAILEQAIDSTAELFQEINTMEDSANPAERQQTKKIKKDASSALTKLYNRFRKLSLPMTMLMGGYVAYAQYNKKEDTHYNDNKHLDRGHLSAKMAIVDTYLSSDVVDTYNKCVDFLQARKDGEMSPEEIEFKEKMAQRFLPFGYGMPAVSDLWRLHKINNGDAEYTKEALASNTTNWQNRIGNEESSMMGGDEQTADRVRADMFRKYLGLEQYFGSVKPADFKPSQSKETGAKYFQFDPQEILKSIFAIKSSPFKQKSFDYIADYIKKI